MTRMPTARETAVILADRYPLTARRVEGGRGYAIFAATPERLKAVPQIKRIALLTASGFFVSDDREFGEAVSSAFRFAGKLDLRAKLALIRKVWEAINEDLRAEAEAERYAESAWLRAAEMGDFDPEEDARERWLEWLNTPIEAEG